MRHRAHGVFDVSVVTPSGRASFEVGPGQGGASDYDRMARQTIWLAVAMDARDPWGEHRPRFPRVEEYAVFDDAGEPVVTTRKKPPFDGVVFREYYDDVVKALAHHICSFHSSKMSSGMLWCDAEEWQEPELFAEFRQVALVMMDYLMEAAPHVLNRAYDLGVAPSSLGYMMSDMAIHGRGGHIFTYPRESHQQLMEDLLAATLVIERDEDLAGRVARRMADRTNRRLEK
jgi:hypothetical protein